MNKLIKGLVLFLVIASPVAMTVSNAQAATVKPAATAIAGKHHTKMHKHHSRHNMAKSHR